MTERATATLDAGDRDIQFRNLSPEQREALMVQVARRFYENDMTMGDLAAELGLTRWQASRLITEARETGIVRIQIVPRTARRTDQESALVRRYGLAEAVVVPLSAGADEAVTFDQVARAAARLISVTARGPLLGVSWGRTMTAVAAHLPPRWNPGVEVVLVNGATSLRSTAAGGNNAAELFAHAADGSASLLPVPAIVGKASTRRALEEDPAIGRVLDLARRAPVVCFGMGAMTADSVLVRSGFLSAGELADLAARGAVGDLLGRFVDGAGRIASPDLDARTIGLDLADLAGRDQTIGIVAGRGKEAVALAALRGRLVTMLVCDERTATHLLQEELHG